MNNILGIIPARGGSKGIPGKNIKLLGNEPLLFYTTLSANKSNYLTKTILSTDSVTIAEVGRRYGIEVPFLRPMELAQDETSTLEVVYHAVMFMENLYKTMFNIICILQPTSPFRPNGLIDRAIDKFIEMNTDSLVSVLPIPHCYNPHWVFEDRSGILKIATGEKNIITNRQKLPKAFFRDGAIYLLKRDTLLKKKSLFGDTISYLEGNWDYYVNIDTIDDWAKADDLLKKISLDSFF